MSKNRYYDKVSTISIAGSSGKIISNFWFNESQDVILIDDASKLRTDLGPATRMTPYKIQNFVVRASSISRLKQTLQNLKTSPWWNHMASFVIIDESVPHDESCSNAFKILSTAWKMNLLHAKLICHHQSKGSLIYSYNPYTNQAPLPWQLVKTYTMKINHPWTLLVRRYQDGQEICKDLDFDKSKDLGAYETRFSSFTIRKNKNWSDTNLESIGSPNGIFLHYIFRALNSSVKIFAESPKSIFNLTTSGFADMSLNVWYQQNDFNTLMTYPCASSGLVIMTKHRGQLSKIGKLLRVLDIPSRYAVVIVFLVTFIFFKFFVRQSVISAILNIVRLIWNTAVPNLPNNVAMRIYLSGLFIFSVTLQGIYQGQLASLLTKQVNLKNVDTLEDLQNLDYTIYCHDDFTSYLETLNFSGRIVSLEDFHCEKYVLEEPGAACVRDRSRLVNTAMKYDLHISSDYFVKMFVVYLIREDWPVEKNFNIVFLRLIEADIYNRFVYKNVDSTMRRINYNEKEKDKQRVEVITLPELTFGFAILGIGLAFSTVIFIVEILMQ